jgi:gas vesicle protein
MFYKYPKYTYPTNNVLGVLGGALIGALAGTVVMLLLAPQSGKDTRKQIQEKGIELRNWTTGMVENTLAQVRLNMNKVEMGVKTQEQLEHRSDTG